MTTQVIEVYVDGSANHQSGVAVSGMWIPSQNRLEFKEYYGKVKSTSTEIMGASEFINELPQQNGIVYNINTDCQKIAEKGMSALNIFPRNDLTFNKVKGHDRKKDMDVEFRKVDIATRKKVREIVSGKAKKVKSCNEEIIVDTSNEEIIVDISDEIIYVDVSNDVFEVDMSEYI